MEVCQRNPATQNRSHWHTGLTAGLAGLYNGSWENYNSHRGGWMYAIIEAGGKQYRVAPGDVIRVESVAGEKGTATAIGRVLAVSEDQGGLLTGAQIADAKVEGTILRQARARKVLVFHYKRKKQYKKTRGHRQNYTELRVDKVTLGGLPEADQRAGEETNGT